LLSDEYSFPLLLTRDFFPVTQNSRPSTVARTSSLPKASTLESSESCSVRSLALSFPFLHLTYHPSLKTGTDHPFFPPLENEGSRWKSVDENLDAIAGVAGWGDAEKSKVMGTNAVELFGIEL
jgi:hypothetical protein